MRVRNASPLRQIHEMTQRNKPPSVHVRVGLKRQLQRSRGKAYALLDVLLHQGCRTMRSTIQFLRCRISVRTASHQRQRSGLRAIVNSSGMAPECEPSYSGAAACTLFVCSSGIAPESEPLYNSAATCVLFSSSERATACTGFIVIQQRRGCSGDARECEPPYSRQRLACSSTTRGALRRTSVSSQPEDAAYPAVSHQHANRLSGALLRKAIYRKSAKKLTAIGHQNGQFSLDIRDICDISLTSINTRSISFQRSTRR